MALKTLKKGDCTFSQNTWIFKAITGRLSEKAVYM